MSYSIFANELDELIREIRSAKEGRSSSMLGYVEPRISEGLQKRFSELLIDMADYADAHSDTAFAFKLREMHGGDQNPYRVNSRDIADLEAAALRADRSLRVYVPDLAAAKGSLEEVQTKKAARGEQAVTKKVFVVHGHDDAILHEVCRLLERLGLEALVLREQPNKGATIIEKFEEYSGVSFAVVLMTSDDMGASLSDAQEGQYRPRARQNVIMELGFFVAQLGRPKVAVLTHDGVEVPSDILGVVYTNLDAAGAWRFTLGRELKAAGFEIDMNRLT